MPKLRKATGSVVRDFQNQQMAEANFYANNARQRVLSEAKKRYSWNKFYNYDEGTPSAVGILQSPNWYTYKDSTLAYGTLILPGTHNDPTHHYHFDSSGSIFAHSVHHSTTSFHTTFVDQNGQTTDPTQLQRQLLAAMTAPNTNNFVFHTTHANTHSRDEKQKRDAITQDINGQQYRQHKYMQEQIINAQKAYASFSSQLVDKLLPVAWAGIARNAAIVENNLHMIKKIAQAKQGVNSKELFAGILQARTNSLPGLLLGIFFRLLRQLAASAGLRALSEVNVSELMLHIDSLNLSGTERSTLLTGLLKMQGQMIIDGERVDIPQGTDANLSTAEEDLILRCWRSYVKTLDRTLDDSRKDKIKGKTLDHFRIARNNLANQQGAKMQQENDTSYGQNYDGFTDQSLHISEQMAANRRQAEAMKAWSTQQQQLQKKLEKQVKLQQEQMQRAQEQLLQTKEQLLSYSSTTASGMPSNTTSSTPNETTKTELQQKIDKLQAQCAYYQQIQYDHDTKQLAKAKQEHRQRAAYEANLKAQETQLKPGNNDNEQLTAAISENNNALKECMQKITSLEGELRLRSPTTLTDDQQKHITREQQQQTAQIVQLQQDLATHQQQSTTAIPDHIQQQARATALGTAARNVATGVRALHEPSKVAATRSFPSNTNHNAITTQQRQIVHNIAQDLARYINLTPNSKEIPTHYSLKSNNPYGSYINDLLDTKLPHFNYQTLAQIISDDSGLNNPNEQIRQPNVDMLDDAIHEAIDEQRRMHAKTAFDSTIDKVQSTTQFSAPTAQEILIAKQAKATAAQAAQTQHQITALYNAASTKIRQRRNDLLQIERYAKKVTLQSVAAGNLPKKVRAQRAIYTQLSTELKSLPKNDEQKIRKFIDRVNNAEQVFEKQINQLIAQIRDYSQGYTPGAAADITMTSTASQPMGANGLPLAAIDPGAKDTASINTTDLANHVQQTVTPAALSGLATLPPSTAMNSSEFTNQLPEDETAKVRVIISATLSNPTPPGNNTEILQSLKLCLNNIQILADTLQAQSVNFLIGDAKLANQEATKLQNDPNSTQQQINNAIDQAMAAMEHAAMAIKRFPLFTSIKTKAKYDFINSHSKTKLAHRTAVKHYRQDHRSWNQKADSTTTIDLLAASSFRTENPPQTLQEHIIEALTTGSSWSQIQCDVLKAFSQQQGLDALITNNAVEDARPPESPTQATHTTKSVTVHTVLEQLVDISANLASPLSRFDEATRREMLQEMWISITKADGTTEELPIAFAVDRLITYGQFNTSDEAKTTLTNMMMMINKKAATRADAVRHPSLYAPQLAKLAESKIHRLKYQLDHSKNLGQQERTRIDVEINRLELAVEGLDRLQTKTVSAATIQKQFANALFGHDGSERATDYTLSKTSNTRDANHLIRYMRHQGNSNHHEAFYNLALQHDLSYTTENGKKNTVKMGTSVSDTISTLLDNNAWTSGNQHSLIQAANRSAEHALTYDTAYHTDKAQRTQTFSRAITEKLQNYNRAATAHHTHQQPSINPVARHNNLMKHADDPTLIKAIQQELLTPDNLDATSPQKLSDEGALKEAKNELLVNGGASATAADDTSAPPPNAHTRAHQQVLQQLRGYVNQQRLNAAANYATERPMTSDSSSIDFSNLNTQERNSSVGDTLKIKEKSAVKIYAEYRQLPQWLQHIAADRFNQSQQAWKDNELEKHNSKQLQLNPNKPTSLQKEGQEFKDIQARIEREAQLRATEQLRTHVSNIQRAQQKSQYTPDFITTATTNLELQDRTREAIYDYAVNRKPQLNSYDEMDQQDIENIIFLLQKNPIFQNQQLAQQMIQQQLPKLSGNSRKLRIDTAFRLAYHHFQNSSVSGKLTQNHRIFNFDGSINPDIKKTPPWLNMMQAAHEGKLELADIERVFFPQGGGDPSHDNFLKTILYNIKGARPNSHLTDLLNQELDLPIETYTTNSYTTGYAIITPKKPQGARAIKPGARRGFNGGASQRPNIRRQQQQTTRHAPGNTNPDSKDGSPASGFSRGNGSHK